jgi:hypothetical protein
MSIGSLRALLSVRSNLLTRYGQRFLLAGLLKGLGSVDFQAVAEAAAKKLKDKK